MSIGTVRKSSPKRIMSFQLSMKLFKLLNEHENGLTTEQAIIFDQMICTSRQITFKIYRNNQSKIGMNMTANGLYHMNDQIGFDMLNLTLVHFKKLAKIQFLKYGKT